MRRIFLICTERSGSNLITQLFNSHPSCLGKSPSHLYRLFLPNLDKYDSLDPDTSWEKIVEDVVTGYQLKLGKDWVSNVSIEEIINKVTNKSVTGIIDYIYEKEAQELNKNILFIKEVKTYKIVPLLLEKYPDAKFIWQVRDPRDVALSWSKSPVHRGDIVRGAVTWKEDQKATLNLAQNKVLKSAIYQYSYEELIADTPKTLQSICDFLALPFSNEMIDFHKNKGSEKMSSVTDNWKNLNKSVMSNNSKKYLDKLTKNQIQFIEFTCKNEMESLGYKLEFDLLTDAEYESVAAQCKAEERINKPEYDLISEEEKQNRASWMNFYKYMYTTVNV